MLWLTLDSELVCAHPPGHVENVNSQAWVTIEGRPVLVDSDPEGRTVHKCPNYGVLIKPCVKTLVVEQGYSALIRVEGKRVCLDSIKGLTDGTPPGATHYHVKSAGQEFVSEQP